MASVFSNLINKISPPADPTKVEQTLDKLGRLLTSYSGADQKSRMSDLAALKESLNKGGDPGLIRDKLRANQEFYRGTLNYDTRADKGVFESTAMAWTKRGLLGAAAVGALATVGSWLGGFAGVTALIGTGGIVLGGAGALGYGVVKGFQSNSKIAKAFSTLTSIGAAGLLMTPLPWKGIGKVYDGLREGMKGKETLEEAHDRLKHQTGAPEVDFQEKKPKETKAPDVGFDSAALGTGSHFRQIVSTSKGSPTVYQLEGSFADRTGGRKSAEITAKPKPESFTQDLGKNRTAQTAPERLAASKVVDPNINLS